MTTDNPIDSSKDFPPHEDDDLGVDTTETSTASEADDADDIARLDELGPEAPAAESALPSRPEETAVQQPVGPRLMAALQRVDDRLEESQRLLARQMDFAD